MSLSNNKIGMMNESSLHRELKFRYAGPGGKTEAAVGEYVADGINSEGEYIEVQTASFAPLQKKIKELTTLGKVRIIHPIAVRKTIEVYEPAPKRSNKPYGAFLWRRKSPKKGSPWKIFDALLHSPLLPLTKRLTIEIVLVDIIEKRIKDSKGGRRKNRNSIYDKELAAWHESILFKKKADYLKFIPFKKGEEFTSSLLSQMADIDTDTSRKALYVLTKLNFVKRKGKQGNSWVYVRG